MLSYGRMGVSHLGQCEGGLESDSPRGRRQITTLPNDPKISPNKNSAVSQSHPFLNKRTEAMIGREFTLEKPIVDGSGTVRIDDTIWRVAGPDTPAGSRVRIVQADGASLTVAAA